MILMSCALLVCRMHRFTWLYAYCDLLELPCCTGFVQYRPKIYTLRSNAGVSQNKPLFTPALGSAKDDQRALWHHDYRSRLSHVPSRQSFRSGATMNSETVFSTLCRQSLSLYFYSREYMKTMLTMTAAATYLGEGQS